MLKSIRTLGCLTALALAASVHAQTSRATTKPTDQEISSKLVGRWSSGIEEANGRRISGITQFKDDGTITASIELTQGDFRIVVNGSGTWTVSDGVLVETVLKTSAPEWLPLNTVTKDRVLSIDDRTFRFISDPGGAEKTYTKIRD